jgi:hypothetical protein
VIERAFKGFVKSPNFRRSGATLRRHSSTQALIAPGFTL